MNNINSGETERYQVLSSLLTHEAAECDDGRNAGEVEEDNGSETLRVEAVQHVAFVLSVATLHVGDHTAKQPAPEQHHHLLTYLVTAAVSRHFNTDSSSKASFTSYQLN